MFKQVLWWPNKSSSSEARKKNEICMQTSFFSVYLVSFVSGCYRNDEIQYSEKNDNDDDDDEWWNAKKWCLNISHPFKQNSKGVDTWSRLLCHRVHHHHHHHKPWIISKIEKKIHNQKKSICLMSVKQNFFLVLFFKKLDYNLILNFQNSRI